MRVESTAKASITQMLVRLVIVAVKYVIFINVYTTSLLKSSLCLPLRYLWMNDYKANGISGRDYYIVYSSVMFGTVHCLVLTDTYLYNFTKGKTHLENQRWRHTTCLQHPCFDVGCYPWYFS